MNFSFWEKDSFLGKCDFCVIGAGLVGLNAALELRKSNPKARIVVLERGKLPSGASTKNAGFACFGSPSELWEDLQNRSADEVFSLVKKRWRGLTALRTLLGDARIGYTHTGGYELFTPAQEALRNNCLGLLPELNKAAEGITGNPETYASDFSRNKAFGFGGISDLIVNREEGLVDTGKMMRSLLDLVRENGIEVWTGMEVNELIPEKKSQRIITTDGLQLDARKTLIAVNGFARKFLPEAKIEPARAQVLITKDLSALPFEGGFHYDRGYYYFRNVGNRVLFGGGRNLDFEAERTEGFGLTERVQNELEQLLREVILPGISFEIDMRWSGIMGVGNSKRPIMKEVMPGVHCAVRMGGMGVAIGTLVGQEAAHMMMQS